MQLSPGQAGRSSSRKLSTSRFNMKSNRKQAKQGEKINYLEALYRIQKKFKSKNEPNQRGSSDSNSRELKRTLTSANSMQGSQPN